jgi:glycosyltransferase involved in cell wall biosynthesis
MPDVPPQRAARPVELSVVVAAYNAADTIEAQLRALLGQEWDGLWEVVIADNGSSDGTGDIVGRVADGDARVRIVDASDLAGAGHARNVGVREALGASIAFCDADDVVGAGWVAAMGDALRQAPFVTGPQEYETLNPRWMHGAFGTRTAKELQWFSGIFPFGPTANLGIRRPLFEVVGGFDNDFRVGQDLDLCLRVWLTGEQLQFVDAAVVHYRYRADMGSLWRRARQYGAVAPAISRRLADEGCSTPSPWHGARNWLWLVRRVPSLRSKSGRARWVVVAGGCTGRLTGSIRARQLML